MRESAIVVDYDENWPRQFDEIKKWIHPLVQDLIIGFEHVGSTSIPGLAAKPVIDIDLIYADESLLSEIVRRLESIGYKYEGNKGIEGRESFKAPAQAIRQHFYVCKSGCLALRNHLLLRDHLLKNPLDRDAYGKLKKQIAPLYEY